MLKPTYSKTCSFDALINFDILDYLVSVILNLFWIETHNFDPPFTTHCLFLQKGTNVKSNAWYSILDVNKAKPLYIYKGNQ